MSVKQANDIHQGRSVLYADDYIAFKKDIVDINNKARKIFESITQASKQRAYTTFFRDLRIKYNCIVGKEYHNVVSALLNQKVELNIAYQKDIDKLIKKFMQDIHFV